MLLAIISAAVCLAIATMMYTPKMRNFQFYRPVAFLFLFEGIWVLLDYIFRQIVPDNIFMQTIHYVGLIVLGAYFVLKLFMSSDKKLKKKKNKDFD